MKKLKRYALAVLLLPLCYGMAVSLWEILSHFKDVPEGLFYFLAGIASYFAFQWVFFRPIRTYVFLAPHARIRSQIVPAPPPARTSAATSLENPPETTPRRSARGQRWAELLARVFGLDMQKCVDCGGPLKIVSAILEPFAIQSILTYLELPDKPPELAPAQIPEQTQFA